MPELEELLNEFHELINVVRKDANTHNQGFSEDDYITFVVSARSAISGLWQLTA
jgi:hypothetical protein